MIKQKATKLDRLFLVSNQKEYRRAFNLSGKFHGSSQAILSFSQKQPYFMDHLSHLPGMHSWQDFSVLDPGLNRFDLENYPEIDALLSSQLNLHTKDPLAQTSHFLLGLNFHIGNKYFKIFSISRFFFERYSPDHVYFHSHAGLPYSLFHRCINQLQLRYFHL